MEFIFHEIQEGSLCAQHCLNSLLQGDYYSAVDLAHIGQQLDSAGASFVSFFDVFFFFFNYFSIFFKRTNAYGSSWYSY
jgi:hypothetical protein